MEEELTKAIDRLLTDPKFVAAMRKRGIQRISRALVIRNALIEYLERQGITDIYEAEDK